MPLDITLIFAAVMLGLAGTPHCAAMCGPSCAALLRGCGAERPAAASWAFHAARLAGYAAAGAVVAAGVAGVNLASGIAPMLRPLWTLMHAAAFGLGLWLLFTAQQPGWMARLGRPRSAGLAGLAAPAATTVPAVGWQRIEAPQSRVRSARAAGAAATAATAGAAWVAWPCGLLQSALIVAALANTPQSGAAVMAGFGLASAGGLVLGPWMLARWRGGDADLRRAGRITDWATRAAGAALAGGSAFALAGDAWGRALAYCLS
jgi:uncharacterized protein